MYEISVVVGRWFEESWNRVASDDKWHRIFSRMTAHYHSFFDSRRDSGQRTGGAARNLKVVVSKTKPRVWLGIPMLHISPPRPPLFSHVRNYMHGICTENGEHGDFVWKEGIPFLLPPLNFIFVSQSLLEEKKTEKLSEVVWTGCVTPLCVKTL